MIYISNSFIHFFKLLFILVLFICIFFIPFFPDIPLSLENNDLAIYELNPNGFIWPTPGYNRINSYFGKRNAPTKGASTFHKGIDIGAPEGTTFIAVTDGEITFTNFLGGGGYTITLTTRRFKNIILSL